MNPKERKEFIVEIRAALQPDFQHIVEELRGEMLGKFAHHEELLETIAMAVNAHATVLDTFEPKVKDHDDRLERLERTAARIRLAHGLR
jgi:hypothetical protein